VFKYVREKHIKGYIILANSDIFFDESINNIRHSMLDKNKIMLTQLRYEYDNKTTLSSPIFGPRFDSQDTWIYHTNFSMTQHQEEIFAYQFGYPGCDNKFIYLANILGYRLINDPIFVKTYHFHRETNRDYNGKLPIQPPWGVVLPANYSRKSLVPSMNIDLDTAEHSTKNFTECMFNDNDVLREYITNKLLLNQPFIIPRVAGVENNFAVFAHFVKVQGNMHPSVHEFFQMMSPVMKKNAGILLSNTDSIIKYSDLYLSAFEHCELFTGWESWGNIIPHIKQSYSDLIKMYPRKIVWAFALDIFHYIYNQPWTVSLKKKRLLIISPFEESIKEKLPIRRHLYDGIDLFPDCPIITIKPPITNAKESSQEFIVELSQFYTHLDPLINDYDVALVSAGGYGNLICDHIYQMGKSAIYIGGVLQMYFGIFGQRWLNERSDIIKLFRNQHWSRPKQNERPKNHEEIEQGCYW
jgi:hypothetical protein